MADINMYLDEIRNALYGEEVRSSIINALSKVNDDNNSYIAIKNEIIRNKDIIQGLVDAFDGKVLNAETVKKALDGAVAQANTAQTAVENATALAKTATAEANSATSNANSAKANVVKATTEATTATKNATDAKGLLDASITKSGTAKKDLETVITTATSIKNSLDTTNKSAKTLADNLNGIITTASSARTELQKVIDSANSAKSSLSTAIHNAEIAKTNLDASNTIASKTLQSLSNENASAKTNLAELRSETFNAQEILHGVADVRAYIGLCDDDVLGIEMDYRNKTCKRIAGAKNLTAGSDFDKFAMYGGRKRCNVADDGTIVAFHGDPEYKEDGSMGQVMVYQPKFYYMVCPIVYEPIKTSGIGYHLRKANYYVSEKPRAGFKLHPAFYDKNGNQIDYVLMGAYEACIYDTSAKAYLKADEQVGDFTALSGDKLSSIANAKPASGLSQSFVRPNVEQIAQNRGAEWHSDNIKITSMNQLLMIIELGGMNTQELVGQGVTQISDVSGQNCSIVTGGTSTLGNATGMAEGVNGKVSISYRGLENPWGNIYKFIYGLNIWGNGQMDGGQPFICKDFNFAESKNSENYEGAGFTVANKSGYISAMGYSTTCDWLFLPSETDGNSSVPVGDYTYVTENLNGYRIASFGGSWYCWGYAGGFCWRLLNGVGARYRDVGGRLVYVPTAKLESGQETVQL